MPESQLQSQENEDLLMEILVRLPVKSLIQCTCVCKYWLSLIRSPEFVAKHYSTRSKLSEYDSILSVFRPGCSISIFNYQDLTFETTFKFRPAVAFDPLRFEIYHRDIITHISIVGPCNGLFLIQLSKGYQLLLLWNPATRELFKLPEIPNGCCIFFGLGFDPVTHDYKVVGLYGYSDARKFDNTIVWLYSLAANSWRRLFNAYMNLTHFCYLTRVNYYLNTGPSSNGRMLNWMLDDDCLGGIGGQRRNRLLSFDMVDEVFVETPLPLDAPSIIRGFLSRGSNHMYPSIYCVGRDFQLHVWDLQQYGPTGVWKKVLNLKFPTVCGPLHMVLQKNEEFVFSNLGTVSSFNLTTQQLESLLIPADDIILAYTESLVSIASSVRQPPPNMDDSSAETVSLPSVDDQQATQLMKSLRIPADDNNLAYTESSPTTDETVPLQLEDEGHVENQQTASETTMIHQMQLPKEDDDSDDSSTDSAFLTPDITPYNYGGTVYIDYEKDLEFSPLRRNEVERLSKLPYCLHEINKPRIYHPCTF